MERLQCVARIKNEDAATGEIQHIGSSYTKDIQLSREKAAKSTS